MYLILQDISKRFGPKTAVENFNLEIAQGEFVTLVGPSGCGKTTTLKMVGGFIPPSTGTIRLEGADLTGVPPEKRPLTTVFQSYALFPHMTVRENVLYGLRYQKKYTKKDAEQQVAEMLALVHLEGQAGQNVTTLSGGQQQRVALARALILKPKVLLLDEPFSNLDAKLRQRIRKEIKEIQLQLGMTMLFVTHDQEEALSLSDRIVVMREGRIEQTGTPQEVYTRPSNGFVADFIGRANILESPQGLQVIRPEQIVPAATDAIDYDFRGVITHRQYMGAFTTYFVDIGGQTLQMDLASLEDQAWSIGQTLTLKVRERLSLDRH